MQTNQTLGIIAGITAASIWGGMYVISKVVLEVIPPGQLVDFASRARSPWFGDIHRQAAGI